MNNIIRVARNRDEIMRQESYCPICNEQQYSPFDKLFTETYSECVDCTHVNELEDKSENVFKIL